MSKVSCKSSPWYLLLPIVFSILLACLPYSSAIAVDVGCGSPIVITSGVPYSGTTIRGPSRVVYYGCTTRGEAGPEIVHSITTPFIQADITATLSNLNGVDLDVFILKNTWCESDNCVFGNNTATYTKAPPGTNYIVVDGYGYDEFGARGPYTLTVTATCSNPINLTLGVPYSGETNGGPPNNVSSYNCSSWNESGPEVIHRVTISSGSIKAELSNLEADLDVFILSSCEASSCVAYGNYIAEYQGGSGVYYIVVDGYNGAAGAYTITVTSDPCAGLNCNDNNACTEDWCDPAMGCRHDPVECNDRNACTEDGCDPATGCINTPISCDDRNMCTNDSCNQVTGCIHESKNCDDVNPCTIDSCDPEVGCTNRALNCDDGDACTADWCTLEAGCKHRPVLCNDEDACTQDWCDPATGGCIFSLISCDDGNLCTTDSCNPATGCINTPISCDDRNICTTDSCNPATGCINTPISCDDGNLCTTDSCNRTTGCTHTPINCDDGDPCTVDSCHPATGECRHAFICHPPQITSSPIEQAAVGERYKYDVDAEDQDDDTLTYSLENPPAGMTIDPETGLISWIPAPSDVGRHSITVRVEDQTGQFDSQTYSLFVIETEFIFRGHVYQGIPPDTGQPLSGAVVELYGDTDEQPDNDSKTLLAGSVTDSSGEFSLAWARSGDYPYLHIVENNPTGMYSTGAHADEPGYMKNVTIVSYLNNEELLPRVYNGIIFWDDRLPFSPADFGPSADHINFDDLADFVSVKSQFTMQGVLLQSTDGSPLHIVTARQMAGGRPQSPPYAASTADNAVPLEIALLSPRTRIGFTFFLHTIEAETIAILKAYDADDHIIQETSIQVASKALRDMNAFFIGAEAEDTVIQRVTFDLTGIQAPKVIDNLMIEPAHESSVSVESWQGMLLSPDAIQEEKLAAVDALQLQPSQQASSILQGVACGDPDLYVRERAIMALAQVRDPGAIPALVEIGVDPPTTEIRMAVFNTVWALRQIFPVPGMPEITIEAVSPIRAGEEFDVEAWITSPVNWDNVQIAFDSGKLLERRREEAPDGYKGPLVAGQPVSLRARFLAERAGRTKSQLTLRINLNRVDTMVYRVPLYIDIQEGGGSASMSPFSGLTEAEEHLIPIDYE
ncbi:MAG: putative Ig domain-containing protein [bacterium]